ncbi:MAG: SLBB domain-containing protein [Candidatus Krumholzibacteriota bacterium]|nr:SLBB domain-containing protein [Candidatus Krumholzibacteriota bacterium]
MQSDVKEAITIKEHKKTRTVIWLLMIAGLLFFTNLQAQEIRLRRGDRLELTVPQRQEMGRQLIIDETGRISIPIIGDLTIEGMLLSEAEAFILRELRQTYPSLQRITLTLLGEDSRRQIYVHGAVRNPGKYLFVSAPNVWEAVREAGGTNPGASLETVRIIRAEGEGRRTFIVNLQRVIENGNFESLPQLRPGDTVIVPETAVQYTGSGSVKVIGAVVNPAPYMLSENKTLVDALLAAGGPVENADINNVRIIRHLPDGATLTIRVDFSRYLENGDSRHNPFVRPEDTVNVPLRSSFFRSLITDPRIILGTVTATATMIAVFR